MSSFIQQTETSYAAHTGQPGQIVGMLEQMLSRIQSDFVVEGSAIVDKATVAAQDARVKKMMKLETWFSEGSLEPFEELYLDWLESNSNRQLLFNYLTVCSIARGWYPTPSEVYLSESRRRLGSAIDVQGVTTEFVQHETDTLKEHHQQLEEAQLACAKQTSVRDRAVRTEIVTRCRTS